MGISPIHESSTADQVRISKLLNAQIAIGIIAFLLCIVTAVSLVPLFKERARLQKEVVGLRRDIAETSNILRKAHPVDPEDAKLAYSRFGERSRLMGPIFRLREEHVEWKLGGTSPTTGFDSPSFAAYVLETNKLIPQGTLGRLHENVEGEQAVLRKLLPASAAPEIGGIVFYDTGYTMFYYKDKLSRPFVIGMTPFGVASFDPDFAKVRGYGAVGYEAPH